MTGEKYWYSFSVNLRACGALIVDLKPKVFEDIIALACIDRGHWGLVWLVTLFRTSPEKTTVKYDLPKELEPLLKDTYGMIVYQEQVGADCNGGWGFSLGQSDMLRRAMGKRKKTSWTK